MNSNQPKPAPTAEEQPLELPPLDVTQEERTQIETMRPMAPRNTLLALERLACRERQLLAALRSNREKDAKIAELEKRVETLTVLDRASEEQRNWLITRNTEVEASLRAVSEAMKERLTVRAYPAHGSGMIGLYDIAEVDSLFARIRAIVEGK